MKNTKNIIIITMIIIILGMAVAYSAFATELNINGTAEIVGVWNVRISNVEVESYSENCDPGEPQYTNTSATFDAKLMKPGDMITYKVTIENAGTIDAKLANFVFKEDSGSPAITHETTEIDVTLNSGEETSFLIKIGYDESYTDVPEIKTKTLTGIIEYVQK